MSAFAQNATVVFVHGAWADGSCWQKIILPLEREGLRINCASLPLTSLSDDIAALERVIERTKGPVLLAGHAYGGAPVSGTKDSRVKSLVYVAALAPAEGETVADLFYRARPHPQAPAMQPDSHGLVWMPEDAFARGIAHRASADEAAILQALQRPIALKCVQEKAPLPGWKAKPSWFLIAGQDRMISPETQRFLAERMGATIREHDVDHSPMYTAPAITIGVILEAARATLGS